MKFWLLFNPGQVRGTSRIGVNLFQNIKKSEKCSHVQIKIMGLETEVWCKRDFQYILVSVRLYRYTWSSDHSLFIPLGCESPSSVPHWLSTTGIIVSSSVTEFLLSFIGTLKKNTELRPFLVVSTTPSSWGRLLKGFHHDVGSRPQFFVHISSSLLPTFCLLWGNSDYLI